MRKLFRDFGETKETKAAIIFSLALIVSTIMFCFGTRYQMVRPPGDSTGFAFMYDRMTGRYWGCAPTFYFDAADKKR